MKNPSKRALANKPPKIADLLHEGTKSSEIFRRILPVIDRLQKVAEEAKSGGFEDLDQMLAEAEEMLTRSRAELQILLK